MKRTRVEPPSVAGTPQELPPARRTSVSTLSVVMPVHNGAGYIEASVRRVLDQTYPHVELILVDDGSDDDTHRLAVSAAAGDPRVRVHRSATRTGPAASRNLALRMALGEYVWFVDSDDAFPLDAAARLMDAAAWSRADLVVARATRRVVGATREPELLPHPEPGVVGGDDALVHVLEGSIEGFLWNKVFSRRVLPVDPFPGLRSKSDLAGLIRILERVDSVAIIPDVVYEYRFRNGSVTNSRRVTPRDYLECWTVLQQTLGEAGDVRPPASAISEFKVGVVALGVLSEVWRFGPAAIDGPRAAVEARGLIGLTDVIGFLRRRQSRLALKALAARTLPGVYAIVLRWRRGRAWALTDGTVQS